MSAVYADTDSSAPVILDQEGNPGCNHLAINSIFEAKDTTLVKLGDTLTLNDNDGQKLTYTVEGETIKWWFLDEGPSDPFPINFVIIKGKDGSKVWHYGANGATEDIDLQGRGPLRTVAFCYGLDVDGAPPIDTTETVDRCDADDFTTLDGVEITCPVDGRGDPSGVYSIHSIRKGETFTYSECTCGDTATVCDKSLPAGEHGSCIPDIEVECPVDDASTPYYPVREDGSVLYDDREACLEDHLLREAPGAIVPWNNGSGWCSSILGSISCKRW
jgi:hypothetical protein